MLWAILIFGFFFLVIIGKIFGNTSSVSTRNLSSKPQKPQPELRREIKTYEIKGIFYRRLSHEMVGAFVGVVKATYHSSDPNCIEVITDNGIHVGYLPRGNYRLHKAIKEWHNGQVKVWGHINYDSYTNDWNGSVNIPLGLSEIQIEDIFKVISLQKENDNILKNREELRKSDVFYTMDNYLTILKIVKTLPKKHSLYYNYPLNVIPGFSKKLEEQKDWFSLIKLENYQVFIDDLSDKYKQTTLKRIAKAKEILQVNQ